MMTPVVRRCHGAASLSKYRGGHGSGRGGLLRVQPSIGGRTAAICPARRRGCSRRPDVDRLSGASARRPVYSRQPGGHGTRSHHARTDFPGRSGGGSEDVGRRREHPRSPVSTSSSAEAVSEQNFSVAPGPCDRGGRAKPPSSVWLITLSGRPKGREALTSYRRRHPGAILAGRGRAHGAIGSLRRGLPHRTGPFTISAGSHGRGAREWAHASARRDGWQHHRRKPACSRRQRVGRRSEKRNRSTAGCNAADRHDAVLRPAQGAPAGPDDRWIVKEPAVP